MQSIGVQVASNVATTAVTKLATNIVGDGIEMIEEQGDGGTRSTKVLYKTILLVLILILIALLVRWYRSE